MRYLRWLVLPLLVVMALGIVGCGGDDEPTPTPAPAATPTPTPEPEPVTLRMLTSWGRTDASATDFMGILQPYMERESGGRIVIDWVADISAVPAFEQFTPIREGIYDLVYTHPFYHSEFNSLAGTNDLVNAPYADREACGLVDAINQNYVDGAGVYFFPTPNGVGNGVVLKEAIPPDNANLTGLSLRVYPSVQPFVEELEGIPVAMPITDVYTAFDRGVIEGAVLGGGAQSALTFSWHEVSQYVVRPFFGENVPGVIFNQAAFDALPADAQATFRELWEGFSDTFREFSLETAEEVVADLEEIGMEVITLTDSEAARWRQIWFETSRDRILEADATRGPELLDMAACVAERAN